MKAKELRIGNLVRILTKNPKKEKPLFDYKVEKIDLNDFLYFDNEVYKPIPLTEEWLLKFGFKKYSNDIRFLQKGSLKLKNTERGFKFYYVESIIYITSVHQLQNLYYTLTKTELNYE